MKQDPLVSLFLPSFDGGGAEKAALHLIQGFVERGIKVDLLLNSVEGPYLSKVPPQVRIVGLKSSNILSKVLALANYLRSEHPTVLLSFLDNVNAAGWAKHLTRVRTKIIVSVQNNLSIELPSRFGFFGKLKIHFLGLAYRQADIVVAVSQGVAEDLAGISGISIKDIRVIYNPVVTTDLLEKKKESISHLWFAPGEPPIILGAGRLVKQKDFPTLIRAFSLVGQNRLAHLMIVGEGEERSRLEAMMRELNLENDIALPGFVENPYAYMDRASVFVLSSSWEGLPTVLIEAMACGCPVVATDCPSGPREILEAGKYGSLVAVGDVERLAEAILATLEHSTDTALLQQRAQMFTVAAVVNQYLDLMKGIDSPTIPQHGGV
jgi:glycosyltransferase involved in cell wall biosynthesis